MEPKGIFRKYDVNHLAGENEPTADYFVLRLDSDPHARIAALAYAGSCWDDRGVLASDLVAKVAQYDQQLAVDFLVENAGRRAGIEGGLDET